MKRQLVITLQDDVVVSESSATSGGHKSQDYIPGSLLLGAVAAKLYPEWGSGMDAWTVFHSGKVRFQNGYPLSDEGEVGYPIPMSLHYYKGEDNNVFSVDENRGVKCLQQAYIVRLGTDKHDPTRQPKQLRGGYLTASGVQLKTRLTASMKTAIDPTTGRASESQLFGYQAIQAGQRFLASLDWDADVPDELVDKVLAQLSGTLRLGRSRSAQYGRVAIEQVREHGADFVTQNPQGDGELTLWCLSELALTDHKTGQPVLQPQPAHFGLSSGMLDLKRSFIRTRSYSTFNGKRKAFDTRREVITQGSIFHFTGVGQLSEEQVKRLKQTHGAYQEAGLGVVCVQPDLLCSSRIKLASGKTSVLPLAVTKSSSPLTVGQSSLLKWLDARVSAGDHNQLDAWLEDTLSQIAGCYARARRFNGILPQVPVGPSKSQWGVLYQAARECRSDETSEALMSLLFGCDEKRSANEAICRPRAGSELSWDLRIVPNEDFAQWFQCFLQSLPDDQRAEKVAFLAAEMRKPRGEALRTKLQEAQDA